MRHDSSFDPTDKELNLAKALIAIDQKKSRWTLAHEREFMEELLVKRLHFLLIAFSIFIAAGFTAKSSILSTIIFFVGWVICHFSRLIVYRAHAKHHWIMRLFYGLKDEESKESGALPLHPIEFTNTAIKERWALKSTEGSVSKYVGETLPGVCEIFLIVCFVFSLFAWADGAMSRTQLKVKPVVEMIMRPFSVKQEQAAAHG